LKKKEKNIIVIGGGAAGFFAAITSASNYPGCSVTILEKGQSVLGKVKVSGGGRCNVTNACRIPEELVKFYPRGGKALLAPFHRFNPINTIEWFEKRRVKLKIEPDGRVFPVSNDSQTIVDCLIDSAEKTGVKVLTRTGVSGIKHLKDNKWLITTSEEEFPADSVIVCSGSSTSIWNLVAQLGHTIENPVPSLFTFNIKDKRIDKIPGVSVQNVSLKVEDTKLISDGPLLITHWGISGPAVLKLSAWGARSLNNLKYNFEIIINWLPGFNPESAAEKLTQIKNNTPYKNICSFSPLGLPARLWERLLEFSGIGIDCRWNNLSKSTLHKLAGELTRSSFSVSGKSTFKEEFVTCGGVNLDEVDFKRMESKIHKGLFFAGEVLDIDALTGGFNFQAAWTTALIAGLSA
jgi:hypothetical protein